MFQHFIVTRFSYRASHLVKRKGQDPLNPGRLEHRFNIFRIACLPSMLFQQNQDFAWILLVDDALPEKERNTLTGLVAQREGSYIVTFSPSVNYAGLDWLKPYLRKSTRYVITTYLDDDDAVSSGFTRYIKDHLTSLVHSGTLPPILFMAGRKIHVWDFISTSETPAGYVKPGVTQRFLSGVGMTLLADLALNLSVISFGHHMIEYLPENLTSFPEHSNLDAPCIYEKRELVRNAARAAGMDWDGVIRESHIHIFPSEPPFGLLINHLDNIQMFRMFLDQEHRKPVTGEESFPGFRINMELAGRICLKNRLSLVRMVQLLTRVLLFREDYEKGSSFAFIARKKLIGLRQIIREYRRMRVR
jgi:hypothetical protein